MAKITEGNADGWSAKIRCAQSSYGTFKVEGCFAVIEITGQDIHKQTDYEGDVSYSVYCPSCGLRLYPSWQIGTNALANGYNQKKK